MTGVIELQGVSKLYKKYSDTAALGGRLAGFFVRTDESLFPALQDIDLSIGAGESVGILGRNGAGKSTLLQLLCGVTAPTRGRVDVTGQVAPLISVGVGFHPEMTGRENIYVNGTILGMSRSTIDARLEAIVDFAELEDFIDTPVKYYSSGMFVRLGFSVAVEARPDILLIDEVLAVGDFAFQVKCFERMNEIRQSGATIVVVSHNMNSIRGFCERAIVLHRGNLAFDGSTFEGIARYFDLAAREADDPRPGVDFGDENALELQSFALVGDDGNAAGHFRTEENATFEVRVRALRDVPAPFLWLGVESGTGVVVYSDAGLNNPFPPLVAGQHATYTVQLPIHLPSSNYAADIAVLESLGGGRSRSLVRVPRQQFYVTGRPHVHGAADLRATFTMTEESA